ncbi:caspase-13-like [Ictidomys tridecemlineatus]|nr:caspase-13-like [Ictidomys tridecemlineatus]
MSFKICAEAIDGRPEPVSEESRGLLKLCPHQKFLELCTKEAGRAMKRVLRDFAARLEHKSSDSTFLVFMSHGIFDAICGTTHGAETQDVLPYDSIFQIFNNQNCSHLKDKPKVIIIQACRGGNTGEVWVSDSPAGSVDSSSQLSENQMHDGVHKAHVEKDFVAFCSSTPRMHFVQRSFEIPDVKAQMPTIERQTLTKLFYLFLGN